MSSKRFWRAQAKLVCWLCSKPGHQAAECPDDSTAGEDGIPSLCTSCGGAHATEQCGEDPMVAASGVIGAAADANCLRCGVRGHYLCAPVWWWCDGPSCGGVAGAEESIRKARRRGKTDNDEHALLDERTGAAIEPPQCARSAAGASRPVLSCLRCGQDGHVAMACPGGECVPGQGHWQNGGRQCGYSVPLPPPPPPPPPPMPTYHCPEIEGVEVLRRYTRLCSTQVSTMLLMRHTTVCLSPRDCIIATETR